ncbi:MAG: sugar ABC transporter ATP-binding protein [Candidatus Caldatribacteriaceae bacterium]
MTAIEHRGLAQKEEPFLQLRNVSKRFGGVQALEKVDFEILLGEVHALVGENGSGKSTLVKIATGVLEPEAGAEVIIGGKRITALTPFEAHHLGIHVVHQDLSLFPNLSVAENIASHFYLEGFRSFVDWKKIQERSAEVMERLGISLPLDVEVRKLSIADQQLVAICRAIAGSARLLILDEPTSSLTWKEVNRLFTFIRGLKEKGIAILFISHRLDEVLEIGDRVTVLRDGKKVGTFPTRELNQSELSFLMTGKRLSFSRSTRAHETAPEVLRVEHLSRTNQYRDVSFTLRKGEVLGIIGPRGSGRTEMALSLFGLNPPDTGKLYVEGKAFRGASVQEAINAGIGYVPENRLLQGLVLDQSVENNLVVTVLKKLLEKSRLLSPQKKRDFARQMIRDFGIKAPDVEVPVRSLSGGNQQKVVLAKWILTEPKILILDTPTHGVDIGAKENIYQSIIELTEKGLSIVLISDEEQEVMMVSDRVLVMKSGRIVGEFDTRSITEEDLRRKVRE